MLNLLLQILELIKHSTWYSKLAIKVNEKRLILILILIDSQMLTLLANRPSHCLPAKLPKTHTHTHTSVSSQSRSSPLQPPHAESPHNQGNLPELGGIFTTSRLDWFDWYLPLWLIRHCQRKGPAVMLNNFSLIITLSPLSRQLFEDQPDCDGRGGEERRCSGPTQGLLIS